MQINELLAELFGRVTEHVHGIVADLDVDQLLEVPEPGANPIGWLIWHLTRVADMHVAEIIDQDQLWMEDGWAARFGLEPEPYNMGYGHTPAQVAEVRPESAQALVDYYDAVEARTAALLAGLGPDDLDRIVDRRWDPPVTMGVRLVSIADDAIQHAGQAAYVKGVLLRRP